MSQITEIFFGRSGLPRQKASDTEIRYQMGMNHLAATIRDAYQSITQEFLHKQRIGIPKEHLILMFEQLVGLIRAYGTMKGGGHANEPPYKTASFIFGFDLSTLRDMIMEKP